MMKVINAIKKIVYSACLVFTCMVFLILLLNYIVSDGDVNNTYLISPDKYLPMLLLSFVIGALDRFLCFRLLPLGLRLPVHFFGCMIGFYLVFIRLFGMGQNGRGRFILMILIAAIYAVYVTAAFFVRRLFRTAAAVRTGLGAVRAEESESGN